MVIYRHTMPPEISVLEDINTIMAQSLFLLIIFHDITEYKNGGTDDRLVVISTTHGCKASLRFEAGNDPLQE